VKIWFVCLFFGRVWLEAFMILLAARNARNAAIASVVSHPILLKAEEKVPTNLSPSECIPRSQAKNALREKPSTP
jgi:hypothetical protein